MVVGGGSTEEQVSATKNKHRVVKEGEAGDAAGNVLTVCGSV